MAKSISQIHGNQSMSTEKMPNVLTIVANRKDGICLSISAKGQMVENLSEAGLPLVKRDVESNDREKIVIKGDSLKDFYALTLDDKPSLNWLIGIIDLKETAENKKKGSDFNIYKVRNVDQSFLGKAATAEAFASIKYYTDHLKSFYGLLKAPTNKNFAYDNMGTCQMLALLHKGKNGFKFMGIVLHVLSAPRSAMASRYENSKKSFLGLSKGLAYALGTLEEVRNPVVPLSPYYYAAQTVSEEISEELNTQVEGDWDLAVDQYSKWQNDIIKSFETFRAMEISTKKEGAKPNVLKDIAKADDDQGSFLEEDSWENV